MLFIAISDIDSESNLDLTYRLMFVAKDSGLHIGDMWQSIAEQP